MSDSMFISPKYTVADWKALTSDPEFDWDKAISILEDRLRGRFFRPIELIRREQFAGFAVLALDCLLMETLEQFRTGEAETPRWQGEDRFVDFLTTTSFQHYFDEPAAEKFYHQIRCGILHQAEAKGSSRVRICQEAMVQPTADGKGLIIDRDQLHDELVVVFEQYLADLRDPNNTELRANFRKKMNYICRVVEQG